MPEWLLNHLPAFNGAVLLVVVVAIALGVAALIADSPVEADQ